MCEKIRLNAESNLRRIYQYVKIHVSAGVLVTSVGGCV